MLQSGKGKKRCRQDNDAVKEEILALCCRALVYGVPSVITRLMGLIALLGSSAQRPPIDAVKFFAGDAAVTRGFRRLGFAAVAYDRDLSDSMDILGDVGYIVAISLVVRLVRGGFSLLAPVCSSCKTYDSGNVAQVRLHVHIKVLCL